MVLGDPEDGHEESGGSGTAQGIEFPRPGSTRGPVCGTRCETGDFDELRPQHDMGGGRGPWDRGVDDDPGRGVDSNVCPRRTGREGLLPSPMDHDDTGGGTERVAVWVPECPGRTLRTLERV